MKKNVMQFYEKEDIAIIGMSCRFPGAMHYQEFWNNLVSNKFSVTEIPAERWDWEEYYGDPLKETHKTNSKWGGFIEDIDKFDSLFFNISPKEANYIDPQHRIFLKAVWHTIEDAGYGIESISGKKIGVYAGVSKNDYTEMLRSEHKDVSSFTSTGTVHSILANRVSYLLNLRGKSEVVDTACSSSLVALHNAIRDIRSGDCEAALVGGVNALITPTMYLSHGKSGMLSSEGKCKTFDKNADGYVRGEGVGCIFIKPLNKAKKDGDNILGIIKGTAVNHNGRSNSLTSPSETSQVKLIETALANAELEPKDISYVEAHGTATPLGDPIEINALKRVFNTVKDTFSCGLGSVKTNIGHLESASGMAGLLKVLLSMKYKKIPSTLHFNEINPYIELENTPFYIVKDLKNWEGSNKRPLNAGVSSFGMGGVNAHVIIQEYIPEEKEVSEEEISNETDFFIPFSTKSKKQLRVYIQNFLNWIKYSPSKLGVKDIAYTMQVGRDEMAHRTVFIVNSTQDLLEQCKQYLKNESNESALDADIQAWISGNKIDWKSKNDHRASQIIGLPGYPFERRSCWVGDFGVGKNKHTHKKPSLLTKLTIKASSENNIKYDGEFSISDYFIKNHIVQGECMLPGVAYLELARAALSKKIKKNVHKMENVFWMQPVTVEDKNIPFAIHLEKENDINFSFNITSNNGIHSKGTYTVKPSENQRETIDLVGIKSRCTNIKYKTEIYPEFIKRGLQYKETFQSIKEGYFGMDEALCKLELTANKELLLEGVWEPSLLDGVFQSVVGLCIWGDVEYEEQLLPFFLQSVEVFHTLPNLCYVYVKKSSSYSSGNKASFDMYLCDDDGLVVMEFKEFWKRAYKMNEDLLDKEEEKIETLTYSTKWIEQPMGVRAETPKSILIFDTDTIVFEAISKQLKETRCILVLPGDTYIMEEDGIYKVNPQDTSSIDTLFSELLEKEIVLDTILYKWSLRFDEEIQEHINDQFSILSISQSLIKRKEKTNIKLLYLYEYNDSYYSAIHRMVGGYARTLNYESPSISMFTIGIENADKINFLEFIIQEVSRYINAPLREILHKENIREERVMIPGERSTKLSEGHLLKEKGCYLITGGSGAIGMVITQYLVEKYNATVILIGRRTRDEVIEEKLNQLKKCGGDAFYYAADISKKKEIQFVVNHIKEHNKNINGIIHAAGLIEDSFIINKTKTSFEKVLDPKVKGTIYLDECTKNERLDFFITFSSIASLMPNQGQCDYAAANSFLDHYMEIRNNLVINGERKGISLAINWPLWEEGGIGVGEKEKQHLWQVFGMKPISNKTAIRGFEELICNQKQRTAHQIILIEGLKSKIEKHLRLVEYHQAITQNKIEFSVKEKLKELILSIVPQVRSLNEDDTFMDIGMNSFDLIKLSETLSYRLNTLLNPTVFFECNTISKLEDHIVTENLQLSTIEEKKKYYPIASLIDVEKSDDSNLKFVKRFNNDEFYMKDHIVNDKFNVPGACYIEMARQAASQLQKNVLKLTDNYWPEELSSSGAPIDATVQLIEKEGFYSYEITSNDYKEDKIIHALGKIFFAISEVSVDQERIDLKEIEDRLSIVRYPSEVYEQIIAEGLHVGPSFMPMKKIFVGKEEALGKLNLPSSIYNTFDEYMLHPSLLTGAFQTAIINNKPEGIDTTHFIPVGIDELILIDRIPRECYIYSVAHKSNEKVSGVKKFDLQICNVEGKVIAQLKGFSIRQTSGNINSISGTTANTKENEKKEVKQVTIEIELIETFLKKLLNDSIGLEVEELDSEASFQEFGINSRMIIDLNQRLETVFKNLSRTLFFEYSSFRELAIYFQKYHVATLKKHITFSKNNDLNKPTTEAISIDEEIQKNDIIYKSSSDQRIRPLKEIDSQDIAIVGVAGKYPNANNLTDFWKVLKEGKDCITEIPNDRFDYSSFKSKRGEGLLYSKWGSFIDDVDKFDPLFFNISPQEAEKIDPQERLFLQVVWETLEDAGWTKESIALQSKKVGVFVGALWQPYVNIGVEETFSGNPVAPSGLLYSIPNRVSYYFNWNGPSLAIDTACSSSLTALHYACQSILIGESDSCIVGGVNLSLSLNKYLFLSQNNFLSTDGRCRSFGEGGDGYVPGEGIGAMLLKPLKEALAQGDQIYGVIKGSAVNHGGRTNGYTVPNPNLQNELIRSVIEKSKIDPSTISYVEAHGTGTSLGDPIEITGLTKAFSKYTDAKQFCAIGSLKSNIGHLEAAAGIAGLTKVLLQMKHQTLVPSIHSNELNTNINFKNTPFIVQQSVTPWKRSIDYSQEENSEIPLRAMLSSFGAGGSNAHIIVEEFIGTQKEIFKTNLPSIILLSAKDQEDLKNHVQNLKNHLELNSELNLHDIAYTLQVGREAMDERLVIISENKEVLFNYLEDYLHGKKEDILTGSKTNKSIFSLEGEAGRSYIDSAIKNKESKSLAQLWVNGIDIDWELIYPDTAKPQKVSLPAYPFKKESYWITFKEKKVLQTKFENKLHPLLHRNISSLKEQKYKSVYTGKEFFLFDHRVNNVKVLPGVAYLELAREAGALGVEQTITQIKDVTWTAPIQVNDTPKEVYISIYPFEEEMRYNVYTSQKEENKIHSQGKLSTINILPTMNYDLNSIKSKFIEFKEKETFYNFLNNTGLNLGSGFKGIEKIWFNEISALARINVPKQKEYTLYPGLIDSALQTCLGGLVIDPNALDLSLPFSVREVNIYKEIPENVWSYARKSPSDENDTKIASYDIDILNDQGEVLLSFKDFVFFPLKSISNNKLDNSIEKETLKVHLFRNEWIDLLDITSQDIDNTVPQLILLAGGTIAIQDLLRDSLEVEVEIVNGESEEEYFLNVFEIIKQRLIQNVAVDITLMCNDHEYLTYGFVSGVLKTANQENPRIRSKIIRVDDISLQNISLLTEILEREQGVDDDEIRYIQGKRKVKTLMPVHSFSTEENAITIKEGGVYIITGGFGGLGKIFADHISKTQNTKLILTGRSALTKDKKNFIALLSNAIYYACDISVIEETLELIHIVKEKYGKLDGIIHSAGTIKDNLMIKKNPEEIKAVLSSKIKGVKNLDRATKYLDLDFMIFFSSIAGVLGNLGQSDYASANAYMDYFAINRERKRAKGERKGRTISIDWPLWENGGMQLSEDDKQLLQNQMGMEPLPTSNGIDIFNKLLGKTGQIVVAFGNKSKVEQRLLKKLGEPKTKNVAHSSFILDQLKNHILELAAGLLKLDKSRISTHKEFGEYGFDSVLFTKFSNELNAYYGINLMPVVFYNYSTINEFLKYLIGNYVEKINLTYLKELDSKNINSVNNTFEEISSFKRSKPLKLHVDTKQISDNQSPENRLESIAIIGVSGRFPGAPDLDTFWNNIRDNKDLITEVPCDRWDWEAYYGDPHDVLGKTNAKWGGFISDIDKFDPSHFNISPREAILMDPQQRITIEATYQALEDAGIPLKKIKGSNTGIFIGVSGNDYSHLINKESDGSFQAQYTTGSFHSILVNRISYLLDIHGPSEPVDTACSSSLIAIHKAVENIRNGHCDMAIAGGVNSLLIPEVTISFSRAGMLSAEGRCKTFDQNANGYVRGEGVGIIVLKSLRKAVADGDQIYGVIRSSAQNHGGKANTLTSPNSKAQKELLIKAYKSSNIDPRDVGYIEAHGTGTPLGDPIEIESLKLAFEELYKDRNLDNPQIPHIKLGSVKTNIGHLEPAAGIAGVLKVIKSIQHRKIPGNPHLKNPNEFIQLKGTPFELQKETVDWVTKDNKPRIAGVSSFGFGGANAHIVLEEYIENKKQEYIDDNKVIILLSAKNDVELQQQAKNLKNFLDTNTAINIHNVAYTLQIGRNHMTHRLAVICKTVEELRKNLEDFIAGTTENLFINKVSEEYLDTMANKKIKNDNLAAFLERKDWNSISKLWIEGNEIDWDILYLEENRPYKVSLPTYPFSRNRFWVDIKSANIKKHKKTIEQSVASKNIKIEEIQKNSKKEITHKHLEKKSIVLTSLNNADYLKSDIKDTNSSIKLDIINDLSVTDNIRVMNSNNNSDLNLKNSTPVSEENPHVEKELISSIAALLFLEEKEIDVDAAFHTLGLDSVLSIEWLKSLNNKYKLAIKASILYDYPSIKVFSEYLTNQLEGSVPIAIEKNDIDITSNNVALNHIENELISSIAALLFLEEKEIDVDTAFHTLGLDSVLGIEWLKSLNNKYKLAIKASILYDYPSIKVFSEYLTNQLEGSVPIAIEKNDIDITSNNVALNHIESELLSSITALLFLEEKEIDVDTAFHTLGLDSVLGIEWLKSLNNRYKLDIKASVLYDYPSIKAFSEYLTNQLELSVPVAIEKNDIDITSNNVALNHIENELISSIAALLFLEEKEIDVDTAFHTLGLDSVLGIEWLKSLNNKYKLAIKASILYDYPSIKAFAGYIGDNFISEGLGQGHNVLFPEENHQKQELFQLVNTEGTLQSKEGIIFEYNICASNNVCLQDHLVFDKHVMPADGYVELIYSTLREYFKLYTISLKKVRFHYPLIAVQGKTYSLQLQLKELKDRSIRFIISSGLAEENQKEKIHMRGFIESLEKKPEYESEIELDQGLKNSKTLFKEEIKKYAPNISLKGIYSNVFSSIQVGINKAIGIIEYNTECIGNITKLLDSALGCAMVYGGYLKSKQKGNACLEEIAYIPYTFKKLELWGSNQPGTYKCLVRLNELLASEIILTIEVFNTFGNRVLKLDSVQLNEVASPKMSDMLNTTSFPIKNGNTINNISSANNTNDIAIVGIASRFPGAPNKEIFWENLKNGVDSIEEIGRDRWGDLSWYHPDPEHEETSYTKWGGFIKDSDKFDPLFFGISPREAEIMDPQQRVFLEECWNSIEDAGYSPDELQNKKVGVFVGAAAGDYLQLLQEHGYKDKGETFMGTSQAILAARISYMLNLKGPSLSIDTACSSSLVAVDRACKSIQINECEMALAGGITLMNTPTGHIWTSRVGMPSKDGKCKTFDDSANGIVSSEGVGVLVLKKLDKAIENGDRIYGVIKGSGINQDGKTNGITAPSAKSQSELQQDIYEKFKINPESISYIETHGTGTKLGDPIEIDALNKSFKKYTGKTKYCALGSVKTNIGHTALSAGVSGVIKVLLMMKHQQIVPSLHYTKTNSEITLEHSPFYINTQLKDWETENNQPRRAAISSFGFSGTNAHIIIDEYIPIVRQSYVHDSPTIIVLSAKNKNRLKDQVLNLKAYLEDSNNESVHLQDIAYTLQIGRKHMQDRIVFIVNTLVDLKNQLNRYLKGEIKDFIQGNSHKDKNGLLLKGKEAEVYIHKALKSKETENLARLWVKGSIILDWNLLYTKDKKPNKISLPTYPFARDRYWIPEEEVNSSLQKKDQLDTLYNSELDSKKQLKLHPLLHTVVG